MQIMNGNMTKNEAFFRKSNTKSGKIFEITKNTSLKMLTGKKFVSAHIKKSTETTVIKGFPLISQYSFLLWSEYYLSLKTSLASSVTVPLIGSTKKLNLSPVAVYARINAFQDSHLSTLGAKVAQ